MQDRDSYASRLNIPISGSQDTQFRSTSGTVLATGYERVVIGARGPYVEFTLEQVNWDSFEESPAKHRYYIEFRSADTVNVKLYLQLEPVDYADYLVNMCYISNGEMYGPAGILISPLR